MFGARSDLAALTLLWTANGPLDKVILTRGVTPVAFVRARNLATLVLFAAFHKPDSAVLVHSPLLWCAALCSACATLLYARVVVYPDAVAHLALVYALSQCLRTLCYVCFFGTRFTSRQLVGIGANVVGIYMLRT